MKNTTAITILLALLASCRKEEQWEPPVAADASLEISVPSDSTGVKDVNFYAYSTYSLGMDGHCWTGSAAASLELPVGDYEIYAVANAGRDLGGGLTIHQLKNLEYTLADTSMVPMSGSEAVQLTGDMGVSVPLKRCPATVTADISVSESLRNMTIQSIQLKDASLSGLYFPIGDTAKVLCDFPLEQASETERRAMKRTWIISENCRGTYSHITSQRDKNMLNAPSGATYLEIIALTNNRRCTYRVYLGENNTSDFNIRRNTDHRMKIVIMGEEEIDTRMHSDEVSISDDMESTEFPGACLPSPDYRLTFSPQSGSGRIYTATVELLQGDPASFTVDGGPAPTELQLGDLSTPKEYQIGYNPSMVTSSNTGLVYSVTVRSADGNAYTQIMTRRFCNSLTVYTSWPEQGFPSGGTLDPEYGPGFRKNADTGHYTSIRMLCPGERVTLKAKCEDGFVLQGWYSGPDGSLISDTEKQTFTLQSLTDTLAMRFKREKFYIYTDLRNVEVLCLRTAPSTITEKGAYAVKPGESCTIRGKDLTKPIEGWYDDPILHTQDHLVSGEPSYDFTPTENMKLYPKYR